MTQPAAAPRATDAVAAFGRLLNARRRIDTHAAVIFLTADRAWKMKRPVDLGFLDFSTAAARRAALEAELTLNRRTAPGLYLAVHAITRTDDGAIALDGPGETVDWVLEMKRFADDALLDTIARQGRLDQALLRGLVDRIIHLHADAEPWWDASSSDLLEAVINGNAKRFAATASVLDPATTRHLCDEQLRCLRIWRDRLDDRAARGRVRRGHGDLHLANIAVLKGVPTLFDCLEFDDRLATCDVAYDLAFLLMDLWHRGLTREANIVFNRYCDLSAQDEDAAPLMPLFCSLRAAVRAHVLATRAMDGDAPSAAAAAARSYLDLSAGLLLPRPTCLLAIGGLSGTGKSTLAQALGAQIGSPPGARILRSDVLRKRAAGLAPEQPIPRADYTAAAARRTYDRLIEAAVRHLDDGTSIIVDAAFQQREQRRAIADAIQGRDDVRSCCLWLTVDAATRVSRVAGRRGDASDADTAVARAQAEAVIGPDEPWHRIEVGGTAETVAAAASRIVMAELGGLT